MDGLGSARAGDRLLSFSKLPACTSCTGASPTSRAEACQRRYAEDFLLLFTIIYACLESCPSQSPRPWTAKLCQNCGFQFTTQRPRFTATHWPASVMLAEHQLPPLVSCILCKNAIHTSRGLWLLAGVFLGDFRQAASNHREMQNHLDAVCRHAPTRTAWSEA